jgi:hypothetical protein
MQLFRKKIGPNTVIEAVEVKDGNQTEIKKWCEATLDKCPRNGLMSLLFASQGHAIVAHGGLWIISMAPKHFACVTGDWLRENYELIRTRPADTEIGNNGQAQPVPTLDDIRREETEFSEKTFGPIPFTGPLHHLKKEINEIIEATADDAADDENNASLIEFADCLLLLINAFRIRHPDLTTGTWLRACRNKIINNYKRTWPPVNAQGYAEHVREENISAAATTTAPPVE